MPIQHQLLPCKSHIYFAAVSFTYVSALFTGGINKITIVIAASRKMYAPLYKSEYTTGLENP